MATFLTIFNVIAGAASILGLVGMLLGIASRGFRQFFGILFALVVLLSVYVLLVPESWLESNVASKISYYRSPTETEIRDRVLIQRGEFSFSDYGPFAIEFPVPFRSAPSVEIVNYRGYRNAPHLNEVTAHQAVFTRSSSGGTLLPENLKRFRWIARGTPLEHAQK